MISQKPYLIRAIYEWCQDNSFTPYLAANVDGKTMAPKQYVQDGQIVLNISSSATKHLLFDNEWITFKATFSGNTQEVAIPVGNVLALFAKENGLGMQFNIEATEIKQERTSSLKLVK